MREQGEIVERIAVEPALSKVRDALTALSKPRHQSFVFPFTNVRNADNPSRISPIDLLGLRRDHVVNAELGGDWVGQESEHGRRQHQAVTRRTVALDQCPGGLPDTRTDLARQVFLAPSQRVGQVERVSVEKLGN
jgi:hypothetical protein